MTDYQKMYLTLFHATEKAIDLLEKSPNRFSPEINESIFLLMSTQLRCEDIYIDTAEDEPEE